MVDVTQLIRARSSLRQAVAAVEAFCGTCAVRTQGYSLPRCMECGLLDVRGQVDRAVGCLSIRIGALTMPQEAVQDQAAGPGPEAD